MPQSILLKISKLRSHRSLLLSSILIIATGCSLLKVEPYDVPEYIIISHRDAMNEKFKTKKDVFTEFGAADKKDEYDGIEVWTYNLGGLEIRKGTTMNNSNIETNQNKNNHKTKSVERSIVSTSVSEMNISSATKKDYVTFWFEEDNVIKWESLGYSASYQIKNSQYSSEEFKNYRSQKEKSDFLTLVIGVIAVVLNFSFISVLI